MTIQELIAQCESKITAYDRMITLAKSHIASLRRQFESNSDEFYQEARTAMEDKKRFQECKQIYVQMIFDLNDIEEG